MNGHFAALYNGFPDFCSIFKIQTPGLVGKYATLGIFIFKTNF